MSRRRPSSTAPRARTSASTIQVGQRRQPLVLPDAPCHSRLVYRETGPVAMHESKLAALHENDKRVERSRAVLAKAAIAVGLTTVVAVVLTVMMIPDAVGVVLVAGGGLLGVLLVVRAWMKGQDLDDGLLDAALGALNTFADDVKPGARVALKIDFGGYHRTKPVAHSGGVFAQNKTKTFTKENWLDLRMTLVDGSLLHVTASRIVKRKSKSKRKYTKIKDAIRDRLLVGVTLPKRVDAAALAAPSSTQDRLSGGGLRLANVKVRGRTVVYAWLVGTQARRVRDRSGWSAHNLASLIDGESVVTAVLRAVRDTQGRVRTATSTRTHIDKDTRGV